MNPNGFDEADEAESESDDESYVAVIPQAASRPSLGKNRSSSRAPSRRATTRSTSTSRTGAALDSKSEIRTNNGTIMLPYITFPYTNFTGQGRAMIQVIKIHSLSGCVNFELGYGVRVAEGNNEVLIDFHKNESVIEFYKQGKRYLNPGSTVYCYELQHRHDWAMSTATRNFTEYPQQTMTVPSLNYPIRTILMDELRPYIYEFLSKDGQRLYAENTVLFIYAELEVPEYKRERVATMSLVSDSFDDTPSYYPKTDPSSPPKSPRGGARIKHFSSSGAKGTRKGKKRHAPKSVASVTDSLSSMSVDDVDKKMAAPPVQVPSTVFNQSSQAQVAAPRQTSTVPDQAVLQQQQQMFNEQALQEQQIQFNRQAQMMALQQQQLQQQQQQIMRQRQYEEQMAAERREMEIVARAAAQRRNEVSNREDVRRLLAETQTRLANQVQQQQVTEDDDDEYDHSEISSYFNEYEDGSL